MTGTPSPTAQSAPAQSAVPPVRLRVNVVGRVTIVSVTRWGRGPWPGGGDVGGAARGVLLLGSGSGAGPVDDVAVELLLRQVGAALEDVDATWDDL